MGKEEEEEEADERVRWESCVWVEAKAWISARVRVPFGFSV